MKNPARKAGFLYNEEMIVGIDEVGRGPWAGPLVVGAVVLGEEIEGLTDSKKLSKKRRELLYDVILEKATSVGIGWVHADELDEVGLSKALSLACIRALEQIDVPYHEIIIDGTVNLLKDTGKGPYVTTMKKADLLIPSVSAASIVAKVARDEYMGKQDAIYEGYGFSAHVGYGTAVHKQAIEKLGVTPLHRKSFAPVAALLGHAKSMHVAKNDLGNKTTRKLGDEAENVAANWLREAGHEIVDRNWKTKLCEIDIVSRKDDTLHFVEVKHRKNAKHGDGVAAITPKKLRQMKFAAQMYVHWNNLYGTDIKLAVMSSSGNLPRVDSYLELT